MPPAKKLAARPVPPLGKQRTPKLPTVGDTVLDNGLRVLAGHAAQRHPAVRHRAA
jgi:hypothetical protein